MRHEQAILRLREMAEENNKICNEIESGEFKIPDMTQEQIKNITNTYRYWYQSCQIAAWLLEEEGKKIEENKGR